MSSPFDFVENFLAQPYPAMGLAPSAAVTKTGGTYIQEGSGKNGIGVTAGNMWSRIASAVPFGWTINPILSAPTAARMAADVAATKAEEGAQAVNGKVKSLIEPARQLLTSGVSTVKWLIVGALAVAFIVFAAQVKTLVKS